MRGGKLLAVLTAAVLAGWAGPVWAGPKEAAEAFAAGKALLAKGDFEGALRSFTSAAKADPENQQYFQECALLKRIVKVREQLKTEEDPEAWAVMSRSLLNYCQEYKIHGEALAVAGAMHARMKSGESAAVLADAHLALGQNEPAAALLAGLGPEQRTLRTTILEGIALARLGRLDEARACAARVDLPQDGNGPLCYDAARLYALVGDIDKALALLASAFERTPANRLAALKSDARQSTDLSRAAAADGFGKVLATESKLPADCGQGKGCGGCSKSATCGAATGASAASAKPAEGAGCEHEKKDK